MVQTRKIVFIRELITSDSFGEPCEPVSRVAAASVFQNPLAGRFETDLSEFFEIGVELGKELAEEAVAQLIGRPVSYGKAAIVGVAGDMEHGGVVIHPKLGVSMRSASGEGEAVIPSNVKIGSNGTSIDLPLGHKDKMHPTEKIICQFHESWGMRDPYRGVEVIADDCDFEGIARNEKQRGNEAYKADYHRWREAFPDGLCEVETS